MKDNKKMENQNVEAQNVEAQKILVDGKEIAEQPKKVGVFQMIGNGIKAVGRFVWNHREAAVGIAAGFGLKMAFDWVKGGVAMDEDEDEYEETYDDSEEESSDDAE